MAVENPGSCHHCTVFIMKSLLRWLTCHVSLSGADPCLPAPTLGVKEEKDWGDAGSLLDLKGRSPEVDILDLDDRDDAPHAPHGAPCRWASPPLPVVTVLQDSDSPI